MGTTTEAFTDDESGVGLLNGFNTLNIALNSQFKQRKLIPVANLLSYLLNVFFILFFLFSSFNNPQDIIQMVYSPANGIIQHSVKVFYDGQWNLSPWQGTPTDQLDQLWDDLYSGTARTILGATSAAKLPNETVRLESGKHEGKYMVQLEVFHQLHCLNSIRKSLYPDHYPEDRLYDKNGTEDRAGVLHAEHCIDRIRQGIICHSDVATLHWNWKDKSELGITLPEESKGINFINMESTHVCRNFDAIQAWARERNAVTGEWDPTVIF